MQLQDVFPVLFCYELLLGFPGLILDLGCYLALPDDHGMGPLAVPAQGLWGQAPTVKSLLVLFSLMSHSPWWRALPLLPPDIFPQTRLVGSGKGETRWQLLLVQFKARKKNTVYSSLLYLSLGSLSPYTAGLCLP